MLERRPRSGSGVGAVSKAKGTAKSGEAEAEGIRRSKVAAAPFLPTLKPFSPVLEELRRKPPTAGPVQFFLTRTTGECAARICRCETGQPVLTLRASAPRRCTMPRQPQMMLN
jgi:hypothetical protein